MIDEMAKFREDSFQKALNALVPPEGDMKRRNGRRKKDRLVGNPGEESFIFKMVKMSTTRQYNPVILFSIGKMECELLVLQA